MSWLIKFDGTEVLSDDFTVEELGEVEKVSGVPWSICNPLREAKVAMAFIAVALLHAGRDQDDIADILEKLTLGQMKNAFEFVPDNSLIGDADEPEPAEQEGEQSSPPVSISPGSSTGARSGGGSRPRSARSA